MTARMSAHNELRTLRLDDGRTITYFLSRKRIKNMYLRIHSDCSVAVSAPVGMPNAVINEFVLSRKGYILSTLNKLNERAEKQLPTLTYKDGDRLMLLGVPRTLRLHRSNINKAELSSDVLNIYMKDPADTEACRRITDKWLLNESRRIFKALLSEAMQQFSSLYPHMPELTIRRMKSRWGSCHVNSNRITLNLKLAEAPAECISFVIFHELCHFIHPDHSSSFYQLLEAFCYDWKKIKNELEDSVLL